MQMQTRIVNGFLPAGEFPIYRDRSREISIITSILSTKIHQYQFSIFTFLVIAYVM